MEAICGSKNILCTTFVNTVYEDNKSSLIVTILTQSKGYDTCPG
jgi:hypothetical protein